MAVAKHTARLISSITIIAASPVGNQPRALGTAATSMTKGRVVESCMHQLDVHMQMHNYR
jgi:hypothetical protein